MRILFIHQNFPAQFVHLAPELARRGHDVLALTSDTNKRASKVRTARYVYSGPGPAPKQPAAPLPRLAATFAESAARGEAVARACENLRVKHGFTPDVVFGHIGWGETLFLREIWPDARHLLYAELFYRPRGLDTGFDLEVQRDDVWQRVWITSRQAHLLLAMTGADEAVAPTGWQAASFPAEQRAKIRVIHDGIDTDLLVPDPTATFTLPGGALTLRAGDEVLTFVNRNLEPYRGYHIFMRALPAVLAARPTAQVVIVGGEGTSYGTRPPGGGSWKTRFLDEVKDRLDLSSVHFVGNLPYPQFVDLMRVSRVHAYSTYPFVLSWSMLEAMSVGALVVGSATPPVAEVLVDGHNGRLVDFFDVPAWSATLIQCLAEPQRFAQMRDAARRTIVERYDLRTVCLPAMTAFVEGGE